MNLWWDLFKGFSTPTIIFTKTSNSFQSYNYGISWKTFFLLCPFLSRYATYATHRVASFGVSALPRLRVSGGDGIALALFFTIGALTFSTIFLAIRQFWKLNVPAWNSINQIPIQLSDIETFPVIDSCPALYSLSLSEVGILSYGLSCDLCFFCDW